MFHSSQIRLLLLSSLVVLTCLILMKVLWLPNPKAKPVKDTAALRILLHKIS